MAARGDEDPQNVHRDVLERVGKPIDEAMSMVTYVIGAVVALIVFIVVVLPIFAGVAAIDLDSWGEVLSGIDPYWFAGLGLGCVTTFSVIGGAYGILVCGSSIMGACIRTPRVSTKNLISIVFCEAVGVYGMIMAIILVLKYRYLPSRDPYVTFPDRMRYQYIGSGYILFAAGIAVGFGNLLCGLSVGICGASVVIADAADRALFVRVLVVEIFASALGIFAIIIGIVVSFKCDFSSYMN